MRWISVIDKAPPKKTILGIVKSSSKKISVHELYYNKPRECYEIYSPSNCQFCSGYSSVGFDFDIIAWMEMPAIKEATDD